MEHLLQKSKCSIFQNIFKYMIFQRRFYGVKFCWKICPIEQSCIRNPESHLTNTLKNEPAACLKNKQLKAHLMALWSSIGHMIHVGCLFVTKTCILLLYLIELKFLAAQWLSGRVLVS